MDTFKLVHLLHRNKQVHDTSNPLEVKNGQIGKDTESIGSDSTPHKVDVQEWYTSRFRFQITLQETTKETYMDNLIGQVNQVLEVLTLNTPRVKLALWHVSSVKMDELQTELMDDTMEAIKYLCGFKAGLSRPGAQYFRINLAIPFQFTQRTLRGKTRIPL